jgi:diguanylate cyclase (GGDEF)-like protein
MVAQRLASDAGLVGRVYSNGRSAAGLATEEEEGFIASLNGATGLSTRSLLGVPVVLGNSICGVLLLINRLGRDSYTEGDRTLIKIFAGYISSSIQNMMDGMWAKEMARRDDLTGLFNDRYFHYRLREEIVQADSGGKDVALLFLDVDRFKDINDRYGHLEGSRTLHELGILLKNEAPKEAVAARYGGDEFVLIIPRADVGQATVVAAHLRGKINAASFFGSRGAGPGPERGHITVSVGVATLCGNVAAAGGIADRANGLIRMADSAMYHAKAEGRNRVVVAQPRTKEYPVAAPSRGEPSDSPDRRTAQHGGGPGPGVAGDLPGPPGEVRDDPRHRGPR